MASCFGGSNPSKQGNEHYRNALEKYDLNKQATHLKDVFVIMRGKLLEFRDVVLELTNTSKRQNLSKSTKTENSEQIRRFEKQWRTSSQAHSRNQGCALPESE
jgi:hypothetical protein